MGYLSPPPAPTPVIVYKDVGGLVSDYEAQTEQYRRENREVRLHECRSACTLALSLPNVCVYPDSQIKFHQAYNAITRETDLEKCLFAVDELRCKRITGRRKQGQSDQTDDQQEPERVAG